MDLKTSEGLDLAILSDMTTAITGSVIGAKAGLYVNEVEPSKQSVVGDFTPATYAGYAQQNVTWLAPSRADDGSIEIVGIVPEFRPSDAVTPNNVVGVYVVDGAGSLIGAARFPDGVAPMRSSLDNLIPTLRLRVSSGGQVSIVS